MAKPIGHQARKRFGQNFLQDSQIIHNIIQTIAPSGSDNLVEIGPGLGALTEELLSHNQGRLTAIELDRDLIPVLKTQFFKYENFIIHHQDALKFDFSELYHDDQPLRIVGNLPYNISTPLIFHLLSFSEKIKDMHFMLQKEVVDRLSSPPGQNSYGRLSVMVQYACKVDPILDVPPEAFSPKPAVDSAVVKLTPLTSPCEVAHSQKDLELIVRQAFSMRRKTIRNNLKKLVPLHLIEELGIDLQQRPEQLTVKQYVQISNAFCHHKTQN